MFLRILNFSNKAKFGATGVCIREEGIAIAHVALKAGNLPVLQVCEFHANDGEKEQGRMLQAALRERLLHKGMVNLVLDPENYHLLQVESPNVADGEIRDALRWQIKDLIDFPVEQAVFDYFPIPQQGSRIRQKAVYVAVAQQSLIRKRVKVVQGAKLKVSAIDISELCFRNITSRLAEDAVGVAFLYFGPSAAQIVISRKGNLFLTRSINVELSDIHAASAGIGNELGADSGLPAILDSLILEIQRSLDFYDSNLSQSSIRSLVVAPMEFEVSGLLDHLKTYLGIDVRMLDLQEVVESHGIALETQARCLPAIGGALRNESNLL